MSNYIAKTSRDYSEFVISLFDQQTYIYIYIYIYIHGESLARGPKLLSIYTVEQREFLVRK